MRIGAAMFFTDYSMSPAALAVVLEARGFESLWAPEHSHIPLSRRSPFPAGGDLTKQYHDVMDPFVTLASAATTTTRIRLGTGVALVPRRDPIQTAKQVATLDTISAGRFLFGVGAGWNAEEMADHGTTDFKGRHKLMRERIEAMRAIWTEDRPAYQGETTRFPPMIANPKPCQRPHPPVVVGGAFPWGARRAIRYGDGWIPHAARPQYDDVTAFMPEFRLMAEAAGRDPASVPVTVFGPREDPERLKSWRDAGVARVVVSLPAAGPEVVLPILDRWAGILRTLADPPRSS